MKRLVLFLLLLVSGLRAQNNLDTLTSRYIGPGVLYTEIIERSIPWKICVLKVDLKNPFLQLETVKAKDSYAGLERTSAMSARNSYEGHVVVGAVNAEYYATTGSEIGSLTNIQIGKGEIYRGPTKHTVIGFDVNNRPMLDITTLNAKAISDTASLKINDINQPRAANRLILYNHYRGESTGTDSTGSEAVIRPINGWSVNDTVYCVVESIVNKKGNSAITNGKAVLSGNGTGETFIVNNLHPGDTIKVFLGIVPGLNKIKEMVGGRPKIVRNGVNYLQDALKVEEGSSTETRAPRTVAGISQDSTYLYLVTVDGRQVSSAGTTLDELANLMIKLGLYHAVNLDGGGSTTMVVRNQVMNSTSDGPERSVGNCLLVVSTAPSAPDTLSKVAFKYNYNKFLIYGSDKIQLAVYGNDKYNNPVSLNAASLKYSVTPGLGTVDASGLFTASKAGAKGYLYLKYNDFSDSVYINIIPVTRIALSPKTSTIDDLKPLQLKMQAYTASNVERTITGKDLSWKSSNESVAVVDSNGVITGKAEGKVKITALYTDTIADSIDLTVQIGKGTPVVNQMDDLSGWTLKGSGIELDSTKLSVSQGNKSQGTGSFKIDYRFTYNPAIANLVILSDTIPFYGLPDSLLIDAWSDNVIHKIYYIVANEKNETFRVNAAGDIIPNGGNFRTVSTAFMDYTPAVGKTFSFPVKLIQINVQLMYNNSTRVSGQTYTGTLYLDNLRIKYPGTTAVKGEKHQMPKEYSLKQNYPNPFNPSTVIEFSTLSRTNTTLKVYDLLGREVAVLVNGELPAGNHKAVWNAGSSNASSGIYLYRLQSGSYTETRKMMLIR